MHTFMYYVRLTVLPAHSPHNIHFHSCFTGRVAVCHFVLVFFSPFSIAITSLGEERANLIAFRTFVRFVLVWICRFPLPLEVWEGLRFVIVALPGLISYLFFFFASYRDTSLAVNKAKPITKGRNGINIVL